MGKILRGEVYWADLSSTREHEQAGHRPVLVISHDILNEKSQTAIVLAITNQPQRSGYPLSYELSSELPKPSWVKINQVRTLSIERLGKRIGRISELELSKIIEGLFELVG